MRPIAPCDDVAFDLAHSITRTKADARPVGADVVQADVVRFEADVPAGREPRPDEVLHDLVLAIHGDGTTAAEVRERNAVPLSLELQMNTVMDESFAIHPVAD